MKIKKINCTPKLHVPIRIPKRKDLLDILNELRPKVVDVVFPVDDAIDLMGVFIGSRFNIDVRHGTALAVDNNSIEFNIYYDSGLDEADEVSIELFLITNPSDEIIILDGANFDSLAKTIADSICHEMIHMKQSRSRGFLEVRKIYDESFEDDFEDSQIHLSDPDEIDAYADKIAEEIVDLPDLYKKLENPAIITIHESIDLWAYVHAFAKDMSHPVLRKLLKKIYKNLNKR